MRLEELKLRVGVDELRVGFHERMTVVGGVGPDDRRGFVDLVVNALAGRGHDATELSVLDATGERLLVTHDGRGTVTRTYPDGTPADDVLAALGLDPDALTARCHIRAADLETESDRSPVELPPEIAEAHHALAEIDAEVAAATGRRDAIDAIDAEIAKVNDMLVRVDDLRARAEYANLLGQLDRVRAEVDAIQGGRGVQQADEALAAAARDIRPLARRWRKMAELAAAARAEFGSRDRLDAETLRRALAAPAGVPKDLDALARRVDAAERERDRVATRLAKLAVDQLPKPSHPAIVRLARTDQETVWSTCQHAAEAHDLLEKASIDLGGVDTAGTEAKIVSEIEAAHDNVERAAAALDDRRRAGIVSTGAAIAVTVAGGLLVPPLAAVGVVAGAGAAAWAFAVPRVLVSRASAREHAVLERAGASSYLAFHIRRIDATIDPDVRERLVQTMVEHHRAIESWQALAGDLTPAQALALEPEVRRYAEALYSIEGAAEEIESLQRELTEVAEPALETARAALLKACAPYGAEDPVTAADTARRQAALAETARLQAALEEIEEDEKTLREKLDSRLHAAGFDLPTAEALDHFEELAVAAEERVRARSNARPADQALADLARLEEQVVRDRRPEWGDDVDFDADASDEATLLARRAELNAQRAAAHLDLPDVSRLRDRRNALARRVAVLEEEAGIVAAPVSKADIEPQLLARLAACRRAGSTDEPLFAFLDEPFASSTPADKWLLLDLVERESASIQTVVLTDDPDVIVWARRRAGAGALTLLEPVAEPA